RAGDVAHGRVAAAAEVEVERLGGADFGGSGPGALDPQGARGADGDAGQLGPCDLTIAAQVRPAGVAAAGDPAAEVAVDHQGVAVDRDAGHRGLAGRIVDFDGDIGAVLGDDDDVRGGAADLDARGGIDLLGHDAGGDGDQFGRPHALAVELK